MSGNNSYTIQVYTDLQDSGDPTSGTPALCNAVFLYTVHGRSYDGSDSESCDPTEQSVLLVVTNAGNSIVQYCVEASANYGWCNFEHPF